MKNDRQSLLFAGLFGLMVLLFMAKEVQAHTYSFLAPASGANYIQPFHPILLRPDAELDRSQLLDDTFLEVTGSISGFHSGTLDLVDDDRALRWTPHIPFTADETVKVALVDELHLVDGSVISPVSWEFRISSNEKRPERFFENGNQAVEPSDGSLTLSSATSRRRVQQSLAGPLILPPDASVLHATSDSLAAPGYCYMALTRFDFSLSSTIIIDKQGTVQYFRDYGTSHVYNFQPVPERQQFAVYVQENLDNKYWLILDSQYQAVDTIRAQGNYNPGLDMHEIRFLPNGHVLVIVYDNQIVDLSTYGGMSEDRAIGAIVQELDAEGGLVWEWRSWDHFSPNDASANIDFHSRAPKDLVHLNSIDFTPDGNLILSPRNLDEVTKIDYVSGSGDILWRFTWWARSSFELDHFENWFHRQHAPRSLPNGHIILFDNGRNELDASSSIREYALAESTATLVWNYQQDPPTRSLIMGNAWRLENGNTFIGWGDPKPSTLHVSEVDSLGKVHFSVRTDETGYISYRAYNSTFVGESIRPELTVRPYESTARLYYAQYDSSVVYYRIYSALGQENLDCVDSTGSTAYTVPPSMADGIRVFRVSSVNKQGAESALSDPVTFDFTSTSVERECSGPSNPILSVRTFPNPFNSMNRIQVTLKNSSRLSVAVFNILGQKVAVLANDRFAPGVHEWTWSSESLPSGVYFLRVKSDRGGGQTRKILLMK